jgi:hypothetical protein
VWSVFSGEAKMKMKMKSGNLCRTSEYVLQFSVSKALSVFLESKENKSPYFMIHIFLTHLELKGTGFEIIPDAIFMEANNLRTFNLDGGFNKGPHFLIFVLFPHQKEFFHFFQIGLKDF